MFYTLNFFFVLGRFKASKDCFEQTYDMKTPLAYFLFKADGPGSGLMALTDLLTFHHNEFMMRYKKMAGSLVYDTSLLKIKENDLITYSVNEDLLPLIYTHCDYSLELGKGTKIKYNLDKILQNLKDKMFYGKSIISFEIKEFVYRDDVHSARKFTNLKKNVEQVRK